MIVWDRGRWDAGLRSATRGSPKGHLEFTLDGARLKGRWHLVRMKPRRGEKTEPWLLIKAEDEFARPAGAAGDHRGGDDLVRSAAAPREELAAHGDVAQGSRRPRQGDRRAQRSRCPTRQALRGARKGILPAFLEPSLAAARPTSRRAARNGCTRSSTTAIASQARIDGGKVKLLTRKGLDWTDAFPTHRRRAEDARLELRAARRRDRRRGRHAAFRASARCRRI